MEAALRATHQDIRKLRDLMTGSSLHQDDPVLLKRNNLSFHLLLAKGSGNPILSILLESDFELLEEMSTDLPDLNLERRFYRRHIEISQIIEQKRPEEAKRLIKKVLLVVGVLGRVEYCARVARAQP